MFKVLIRKMCKAIELLYNIGEYKNHLNTSCIPEYYIYNMLSIHQFRKKIPRVRKPITDVYRLLNKQPIEGCL